MRRPITKLKQVQQQELSREQGPKLTELRKIHELNIKTQQKLKKIRDDIMTRMQTLDDYISTHRLRTEYPPASEMVSYIRFQRNTPQSYHEQSKVLQQQEAIKQTTEEDSLFIKKLNEQKPKRKKRDLNLSQLPKDPKLIRFNQIALNSHYKLGIDVYRAWLEFNKVKGPKRPFTPEEEELIVEKHSIYGQNWEKICHYVQNRTFQQVYYEFQNRLNPHMVTGRWTNRHSLMLIILLQHYGTRKWAQISQKMVVKSELQVRQRYCNILNPSIGKNTWTFEMQKSLIELAVWYNFCWKDMVKLPIFQNKTDNCIWRRFRKQMIRKSKQEIEDIVTKKDLLQKILKFKDMVQAKKKLPNHFKLHHILMEESRQRMREQVAQSAMRAQFQSEENELVSS